MLATRYMIAVAALLPVVAVTNAASPPQPVKEDYSPLASNSSCLAGTIFDSPLPTVHLAPHATVHLRGRVDTDFITTTQDAASSATYGKLGSVVGLRRARIGIEGEIPNHGHYVAEIDLASGELAIRDVFTGFGDAKELGEYRGGHFREPFSLEGATSANSFAFMERAPINVLDPARNWGIGLFRETLHHDSSFAIGVFHAGTDSGDFQGGDGATVGLTKRLTIAPIINEETGQLLHFGIALSERVPESGVIPISQRPRSPLLYLGDAADSPFMPVISLPAKYQQLLNLQFAAANGPLWTQAEWYGTWVVQTQDAPIFYHGAYVAAGWFITGEHRTYPSDDGGMGRVEVKHPFLCGPAGHSRQLGWGAWELAARASYLDFFDSNTPVAPDGQLVGVRMPEATFGINWYLADHVRIMFNYTLVWPDNPNTGTSMAQEYAMRLGVFW